MITAILREADFFKHFTQDELESLSKIAVLRRFQSDQVIFSENQKADEFFVLHKGSVNLIFSSKKIIKVGPLQIFGDWAIVNNTVRLATAVAKENTEVIAIDGVQLKNNDFLPAQIALKISLQIAGSLVERLLSQSQISSQILIDKGESDKTEFKSTLRKNLFTGKKDPMMENAIIKTIAAFLNSKGGVLFIGVDDNGQAIGLSNDEFDNQDKFLQHLFHIITDRMGKSAIEDIHPVLVKINDIPVVRIDIEPSSEPVFVKDLQNTENFYVRNGVTTVAYNLRDAITYIKLRF